MYNITKEEIDWLLQKRKSNIQANAQCLYLMPDTESLINRLNLISEEIEQIFKLIEKQKELE